MHDRTKLPLIVYRSTPETVRIVVKADRQLEQSHTGGTFPFPIVLRPTGAIVGKAGVSTGKSSTDVEGNETESRGPRCYFPNYLLMVGLGTLVEGNLTDQICLGHKVYALRGTLKEQGNLLEVGLIVLRISIYVDRPRNGKTKQSIKGYVCLSYEIVYVTKQTTRPVEEHPDETKPTNTGVAVEKPLKRARTKRLISPSPQDIEPLHVTAMDSPLVTSSIVSTTIVPSQTQSEKQVEKIIFHSSIMMSKSIQNSHKDSLQIPPPNLHTFRRRKSVILSDCLILPALPTANFTTPAHKLLPLDVGPSTNLYDIIFLGTAHPNSPLQVLNFGVNKTKDPKIMSAQKVGNRRRPRAYITNPTINILCGLRQIIWLKKYVLRPPG
ncbi:hypothetical protein Fmac_015151 [Flemingia macrophylla]|uniref:Uncharacterized protein n=1 Tax=Flemingia macrophylla TaxID=520843 RepID=A0ABD1MDS1_9FABA